MRHTLPIIVFVTAVLTGQLSVNSQETLPELPGPTIPIPDSSMGGRTLSVPPEGSLSPTLPPRYNGFSLFRAIPDDGAPGTPGHGFHHYVLPMDRYTSWYRPRAATLTSAQRCAPDRFRPRGFGHLFAEPCDGFRMEYTPFVLKDGTSQYGPAYIARQPDPRCEHCDQDGRKCRDCR